MTVSVGLTACPPQPKDLEQKLNKTDDALRNDQVKCDDTVQGEVDIPSSLKNVENAEKEFSETSSSCEKSVPSSEDLVLSNQDDAPEVSNKPLNPNKTTKAGRAVSRGRRKSESKDYNQKSQGNSRNRRRKISKTARDYENSSSNGGNSGADGNGEDNGSDDDDEDDDADEDDDDDDEDDDEEGDDDDDEEDNEDDDDDISLNGNEKNVKSEPKIKQEPEDQEMYPTGLQSFMAGLDGSNIPLADLLEKLPNSVCPGEESGSAPVAPGVPVTLHGIVCHEIGGVLVVNIKWRNKFYCGSLIDCSRHAWASPRFPAADGGETDVRMGGKGGKGKRRQKNNSVSSATGNVKEATPLKHKLRGRKRGGSGCPPPKSQFKGMGKRRLKNMDDDDDGPRPGKRSCTMKTTVSPQPSPTLIECPEPGCDKKYKHINGLRYHQAHAHLEESNQSDERSASTSPSPVEEFKEPDTKPGFKGRTSRVSARARSISPSLAAAIASINEKKGDASSRGGKKKETSETSSDYASTKESKMSKSPIAASEEDGNMEEAVTTVVEISDKCQQACEHEIRKENSENSTDQAKQDVDSKSGFKPIEKLETTVKSLEDEKVVSSEDTANSVAQAASTSVKTSVIPDDGKTGMKEIAQNGQEVWETVIDSGFSVANGTTKSQDLVEDVEKALSESSLSGKQSDSQLCIPGVQPVDLRQAVDTGVGLINQLGIEVEDISENEEDIDPGQDSEYTSKDAAANQEKSCRERNTTFPGMDRCLTQIQKPETNSSKSFSSSDTLRTKLGSSFYFDTKNDNTLTEEKRNLKQEGKSLSDCQSKRAEVWCKSSENLSSLSSATLQRNTETKLTALEDRASKTTSGGISTEDLVSKSISRSAVESPLVYSDAPSTRYKFFACRNYGDDIYDKCIRTSDIDQKGITESKTTLAPIRYPELVRNGAGSEPASNYSELPSESKRTNANVKNALGTEENHSGGKLSNKDLAVPVSIVRTHSPTPEAFNRNLNLPEKARNSMESKSPSSVASLTGSTAKHLSLSRPGFDPSAKSPSSFSIAGTFKMHSSSADRKIPSNPFQPVIVKHEFQPAEGTKGIKQELNFNQSNSKSPFASSASITSGELGKPNMGSKGSVGLNDSASMRKSPYSSQETEDYEKSYKTAARALSRPHPTLISRSSGSLPPSLPVGVALPYPRASDSGSTSSHLKGSENKASASGSPVTSVSHSSSSPRILPSSHDVAAELSQPENKAKQLQTLQVPIPVGEVSPVSLKKSPGPAIHSGLPSVLPIIGPGIKTQGAASTHPIVRPGIKTGISDQIRSERKSETSIRAPSPYGRSKSPVPRPLAVPKPSPERKSPQPMASYQKTKGSEESSREDSDIMIVKEDPLMYGTSKDKSGVEKERERRDTRDTAAELTFRGQEPMSAEQLRNLQLQQQLTLQQYYQSFMQGGMSLEMIKNINQLAYMQGMPVDPKATLAAQQAQLMQLHREEMLEQEKQGMQSRSTSNHPEARNFDKKDIPKQEERRMDESCSKKSPPQGRLDVTESEFRRFPGQSDSLRFASRSLSPKVIHKPSSEEPVEKKFRGDDSYQREREREQQKYKQEEEFLQKQKLQQQISMYKQLESDLQKESLGANFPRKRQMTPEKSERLGNSREDERIENGIRNAREMAHRPQEAAAGTVKAANHSLEAENASGQGSPRIQVVKSQSLSASRSPRPSRSPLPASRYKDSLSASDEKREGSNSLPAGFMPTQFQAYLSQLNFDPSAGPYGAHQMLVGSPQFSGLHPGLVMSMPMTSHGESNIVTSVASTGREREERSPYWSTERERSTSHLSSQSRTSTSESHERLQRLKDAEKESRHSPIMFQEERTRNRSTGEQNVSPKSSRTSDLKGEDSSLHARSNISNNLAISRMTGHMDAVTEEEIIRRQRLAVAAEYGNYYVPSALIAIDPSYTSVMQSPPQHIGRRREHYMAKRQ